jgi:uncharacterized membrane protein YphA (DoxX/SURF4 family)
VRAGPAVRRAAARARDADDTINAWFVAHSIMLLRVTVGAVFFVFGFLKFFPGVSPAQQLAEQTTQILTLGVIPGDVALVLIATLECTIGLCLLSGRGVRAATVLLSIELVGILSPVILLPGTMFAGPHHAPTLAGQYVLKDVILVAAAMVIASTARGARLVRQGHSAAADSG